MQQDEARAAELCQCPMCAPLTRDDSVSLDQLRLMDVARTAAQICADAGKSSCP